MNRDSAPDMPGDPGLNALYWRMAWNPFQPVRFVRH